ncbi:TPA: TraU family protein, partial [Escherichia coli]|nr:TraU family protein [Escherichia coli]
SWLAKENRARIDDVVDFLKNASDSEQYAGSPTIRSRLDEMIVLLDQYTANGTYGQYFNSDEPSLRDDAKMVVLELGGLEDRPSLLVAVMFSLIIYIENRMYRTPRNLKKLNVIDEGWRLLDFKNHKVGEFIEKGYRTARRHTGAYSGQCHPFGRSVMRWETGKNPPNTKKNFGYLMWRKRNCVFL